MELGALWGVSGDLLFIQVCVCGGRGGDYDHTLIVAPSDFQTFLQPCNPQFHVRFLKTVRIFYQTQKIVYFAIYQSLFFSTFVKVLYYSEKTT